MAELNSQTGVGWKAYTQMARAEAWCRSLVGQRPMFACCFGFTETGLIPGISAAGANAAERQFTALADAEILMNGVSERLPTSPEGYPSPVIISRGLVRALDLPMRLFDCGLPETLPGLIQVQAGLSQPEIARCLSTGQALSEATTEWLFTQGQQWGKKLAAEDMDYLVIGESVAGGTTTALSVLMGLGWGASGMVNSSHPICNHEQKLELVQQGLAKLPPKSKGLTVSAAVGDPMQPFVAGVGISASCYCPVLLAGGTQMLAIYALMQRLAREHNLTWQPNQIVVGTTRWVAEDPSGDAVGLANLLGSIPLLAAQLDFSQSDYPQLRAYEQGHVKEGVGAGGLGIAASLYQAWPNQRILKEAEAVYAKLLVYRAEPDEGEQGEDESQRSGETD